MNLPDIHFKFCGHHNISLPDDIKLVIKNGNLDIFKYLLHMRKNMLSLNEMSLVATEHNRLEFIKYMSRVKKYYSVWDCEEIVDNYEDALFIAVEKEFLELILFIININPGEYIKKALNFAISANKIHIFTSLANIYTDDLSDFIFLAINQDTLEIVKIILIKTDNRILRSPAANAKDIFKFAIRHNASNTAIHLLSLISMEDYGELISEIDANLHTFMPYRKKSFLANLKKFILCKMTRKCWEFN